MTGGDLWAISWIVFALACVIATAVFAAKENNRRKAKTVKAPPADAADEMPADEMHDLDDLSDVPAEPDFDFNEIK